MHGHATSIHLWNIDPSPSRVLRRIRSIEESMDRRLITCKLKISQGEYSIVLYRTYPI
jgi:hypothetical protein